MQPRVSAKPARSRRLLPVESNPRKQRSTLRALNWRAHRFASPITGTVTKRTVNDGEAVDPATPAFEVIDSSSLDVVANLPAGYLGRVKTGDLATVHVEPLPEKEFSGGVVQVAPSVDPQTNTVAVRVRLANPNGELKAGIFGTARIAVDIHQNALVVPQTALVVEGDETFVFVPQGDKSKNVRSQSVFATASRLKSPKA